MTGDTPTAPIFVALNAILAAIESGSIEEGEVDWNRTHEDNSSETVTITVRRTVQPRFGTIPPPD